MSFQVPDSARPPRQPTGPARTNRPFPPALEEVFTRRSRRGWLAPLPGAGGPPLLGRPPRRGAK